MPDGELVVHGRQRAGQAAGVPALPGWRRRYRATCDEVVDRGLPRASPSTARPARDRQRRRHPPAAARRPDGARHDGGARPAADRVDVVDGRPCLHGGIAARCVPPGPDVGEIVDGTLPGADGDLALPPLPAGRPPGRTRSSLYFHGGGWVLGSADSDDPLCRDLCVALGRDRRVGRLPPRPRGTASRPRSTTASPRCSGSPTTPRSSAAIPGRLAVGGWSAGANIAAVVVPAGARRRRSRASPGRSCCDPVTDCDSPGRPTSRTATATSSPRR